MKNDIKNDIKNLEWLEIFLWYKCSIKCNFCYQKDLRTIYKDNLEKEEVLKLLDNWYKEWKRFIIFSWWEPTIDNNLPLYIDYSKKLWFEHIRVHTNWYWFKDFKYLLDLYNKWLTGVTISVHWYGDTYDKITWVKGSFETIKKAIKNFELLKRKDINFIFDTNTVVSRDNYKNIAKLIIFLCNFSLTRWQIVLAYKCKNCKMFEKCRWLPKDYYELYWDSCINIIYD